MNVTPSILSPRPVPGNATLLEAALRRLGVPFKRSNESDYKWEGSEG